MDAWDLHIWENCDDKGTHRGANNLSRSEALGRREIQEGIKNRGWILYGTDKSGKLVIDTQANFLTSMEPHFKNEQEVPYNEVLKSEGNLNNHSKAWAKLLNMGMNAGNFQPRRIKEALTVKNSNVAQLRGLRKDHKVTHNAVAGPPLRPLCNGKVGPNAPLGNLMARLLKTVISGMAQNQLNTEVLSTEEVLYYLEQFNNEAMMEVQRMQPGRV